MKLFLNHPFKQLYKEKMLDTLDFHVLLYIKEFCENSHMLYLVNKELYAALYKHRNACIVNDDMLYAAKNIRTNFYNSFHSLLQIHVAFKNVDFQHVHIDLFKELGKVRSVSLHACVNLTTKKINCLHNLHELSIGYCYNDEINVGTLNTVKKLSLECILKLKGVNKLNTVHTLKIRACNNVTNVDISTLGSVRNLTLDYCPYVTDVSCLFNVHTLVLTCLPRISDVRNLEVVPNLTICKCLNLVDYSNLGTAHTLSIIQCPIESVENLKNVHTLSLKCCHMIHDDSIRSLNNPNLIINKCNNNIGSWCNCQLLL